MDTPNANSETEPGGPGKSSRPHTRRSRRIKEAEEASGSGADNLPHPNIPFKARPPKVVKKPRVKTPKTPITPKGQTNALDRDSATIVQVQKNKSQRPATIRHNKFAVDVDHTLRAYSLATLSASPIEADHGVSNRKLLSNQFAPLELRSGTLRNLPMPVSYSSPYAHGQTADNVSSIHGHQTYPKVATEGQTQPRNLPMPSFQIQSLETSANRGDETTTYLATEHTANVADYVVAKRLRPSLSHEKTRSNTNPHEYVSLVNVQRTSDPSHPYPQWPPANNKASLPVSCQSRPEVPSVASVVPVRRREGNVVKEARRADVPSTVANMGRYSPEQAYSGHGNTAIFPASQSGSVTPNRRKGGNAQEEIRKAEAPKTAPSPGQHLLEQGGTYLNNLANHPPPTGHMVGLTVVPDDSTVTVGPYLKPCNLFRE